MGHKSLADCAKSVSPAEFTQWAAYYRLFPIDENTAQICATLLNLHRNPKKHPQPFTRADFLPGLRSAVDDEEDVGESLFNRLRSLQDDG